MAAADRSCPGLFVTGTDTGVGKTMVAAAIARYGANRGGRIGVMKPCETGVAEPAAPGDDARLLAWAAQSADPDELIAPCRLREPLAPSRAAEIEQRIIDPHQLTEACRTVARDKDFMVVEGAGGLMVPLRGGYLMADLARQMGLPLLIVARPGLGTINHTLLTVFAARMMELPIAGIIINRMPEHPGAAEQSAPHDLAALASADLLGVLPEVTGAPQEQIARLAEALTAIPRFARAVGMPER